MAKISIKDLLEAGCHFGHQTRRWNPKMKEYVYGAKNGISIIDLTKTMHQIAAACNFLQHVVADGGDVLFVGTKRQIREVVKALADEEGSQIIPLCAKLEADIAELDDPDEKAMFMEELGVNESGLDRLIK